MARRWFTIALINLLIAGAMGVILRYAFIDELPWLNFRYFLHGHSHLALLGWAFPALSTMILAWFFQASRMNEKILNYLFWGIEISVLGMLISFPLQGYGMFSIGFTILHTLFSYAILYRFWKELNKNRQLFPKASWLTLRAAIVFYVLSTVAIFGLAPVMMLHLQGSIWYFMTVQFYLHFQLNGWLLFGVLGLLFMLIESKGILLNGKHFQYFYWLLIISTFLTYALSVAWSNPDIMILLVNSLGVLVQLAAFVLLFIMIMPLIKVLREDFSYWAYFFILVCIISLFLKAGMQTIIVIPHVAKIAYTIRLFMLGFIHLILLGIVTGGFIFLGINKKWINLSLVTRIGLILFLSGFILSELILFLQGTFFWASLGFIPYFYELLFSFSLLMPLAVLFLIIPMIKGLFRKYTEIINTGQQ